MEHEPLIKSQPTRVGNPRGAILYRYECSCGWKGAGWYAQRVRARRMFDRHILRTGLRSVK